MRGPRVVNVPMRGLLSLPFATPISRRLMLVHYTGRNSGKAHRQPVSYVEDGDTLLAPGGGKWKLNLSEDQPARIQLKGPSRRGPTGARPGQQVQQLVFGWQVELVECGRAPGRLPRGPRGWCRGPG
jgi:hypothetical protein